MKNGELYEVLLGMIYELLFMIFSLFCVHLRSLVP